jgi:glycosyltransferase involved in cell wall biosynthesis
MNTPSTEAAPDGQPGAGRLRPVRVAVVITRLEGGAGLLALRGAAAMDGTDCRPTIIAGSGEALVGEAAAAGIEVIREPSLRRQIDPLRDVTVTRRLAALFADRSFDIVHTHTSKAGVVGRAAARRAGVPRIVHTFHGFPFHDFQSAARRQSYISMERWMSGITDVTLCVGAGVAAEAVRRRIARPDRIQTIGVVVDGPAVEAATMAARSAGARTRARRALGLLEDAVVVGAVGRLTRQKAPEDFLAAMTLLRRPGTVGVWIGGGELAARVQRSAERMTGTPVRLVGERNDVLGLLPAFDVFVLPSLYEGLPTAVIEAMICGVPVVATAVNAVPDVVVPGATGLLVPPRRPDLLATAVGHLLDAPQDAADLADAASVLVAGRYTEHALRDALSRAYLRPRNRAAQAAGS